MQIRQGRVTIRDGVVFGTGGGRELRCDVFTPPQPVANAPAVLLVHGGAWNGGDRSQLRGYGVQLGRRGFVCVACEYRLSGEAQWPAQIHDVKAALRWMRANSTELGIDPARISVSGNSAGAHLALILAGTRHLPEFEGDGGSPDADTSIAAVVAFYAPTQFVPGDTSGADVILKESVRALMGPHATADDARAASPVSYARTEFPPTLLIAGNADEVVPHEASLNMYRLLHAAGAPVELHIYSGAPHAFDAIPEFGRQCVELMTLFLDRYVVEPRPVAPPVEAG